jgi:uncharacterized membrane protein
MLGDSSALELGSMSDTSLDGPAVAELDGPLGPVEAAPPLRRRSGGSRRADVRRFEGAPWLIALMAFVLFDCLSILRYERRETMSWDLGIFTQAVRQYSRFHAPIVNIRGYGLNLLGDHFHPIIALLGPFFAVFPTPVTLLVGQSFLLAIAAVPITRTAMDKLGRHQGWSIGLAYALCWGLVQAANFDFHEVAFAVPLLAFSLCAHVRGQTAKTILWALPLLLVKEDIALLAPIIVATALAPRLFPYRRAGRITLVLAGCVTGAGVMALLVKVVIPSLNNQHQYLYWHEGGCLSPTAGSGIGKMLSCVPQQLAMDGSAIKLHTVLLTLLPVVFVSLRSPLALLAVPSIVLRFLNSEQNYWGTDYHYTAVPMTILFVAAIDALFRMRAARESGTRRTSRRMPTLQAWGRTVGDAQIRHAAVAMLAVGVVLTQQFPLQDLWQSTTWQPSARAKAIKAGERAVPDGVSVETTIDMLAPLAARDDALWIGDANDLDVPVYQAFDLGPGDWNGATTAEGYATQRHPTYAWAQVYADTVNDVYVFKRTN